MLRYVGKTGCAVNDTKNFFASYFTIYEENIDRVWQNTCRLIEESGGSLQAKCYLPNERSTCPGKYDLMIEFTSLAERKLVETTYNAMLKYGIIIPTDEVDIKPTALVGTHDGQELKWKYNSETLDLLYPKGVDVDSHIQNLISNEIKGRRA